MSRPLTSCCRAAFFLAAALLPLKLVHAQSAAVQATPALRFDILEFQVEGNTVLPAVAIENAVTPFLGYAKQMEVVEAARAALEKAYQGAGFLTVFVDVPEQSVESGVVVLSVTEGRVERLSVTGSRYFSQGYIREKVPELADGKVPDFNEVQRELAAVNRTEDRRVQPVMRAGRTPGTVETELKVEDRLPLGATLEVNNRAAPDTHPLRVAATVHYDNLFQLDHSIAFTASTAPQATDESRVFSPTYTIPAADQSSWIGYVVNSNSAVAAVGDVNVLGKGTTLGLRWQHPFFSAADQSHSLALGVDYKDIKQNVTADAGGSSANTVATPLRYLPVQMAYNGTVEHGPQTQTTMSLIALANFRSLLKRTNDACPGGPQDQFACARQGGDGGFATLRGDLRQSFGFGAPGSLHLRLGGQFATGPLPSGEQYAIGGAESVRGYYEAEGAGDQAVLGSIEWHTRDAGGWLSGLAGQRSGDTVTPYFSQSYALAFADVARAYISEPATGQAPRQSLAGAGVGLRVKVRRSLTGEIDVAWPLKLSTATDSHAPRLHVRLALDL